MKYIEFLNEMKNFEFIQKVDDIETIKKIFKEHCKKIDPLAPLWRGMRDTGDYAILDGSKVSRKSKHGSNLHTVMFSEIFKGTKFPRRDKCIIATTEQSYAETYGELYAIFPYDDVVVAEANDFDILFCEGKDNLALSINDSSSHETTIFGYPICVCTKYIRYDHIYVKVA